MALCARDVMETEIVTVTPDDSLIGVQRLFLDEEITGAPVVDETGKLLGVISVADVLRAVAEEHDTGSMESVYFRDLLEFAGPDWGALPNDFQDRLEQLRASDAMSSNPISVTPDTPIPQVAKTLRFHRIHRVLVTDGERLVGIVTPFDLMQLLEDGGF